MLALQYAIPALPDHELLTEAKYDPELQMNVLPDGTPACLNREWVEKTCSTTSTAGSKTHWDD